MADEPVRRLQPFHAELAAAFAGVDTIVLRAVHQLEVEALEQSVVESLITSEAGSAVSSSVSAAASGQFQRTRGGRPLRRAHDRWSVRLDRDPSPLLGQQHAMSAARRGS